MIGQTLAHYRIESKLGEGGMGVVYKAYDTHLDRPVAIKVLTSEAASNPARRQRFIQEARAASALDHPNIVTVHDIAEAEGQHFIVMQYVAGKTLRELLRRGRLPLKWTSSTNWIDIGGTEVRTPAGAPIGTAGLGGFITTDGSRGWWASLGNAGFGAYGSWAPGGGCR